MLGNNMMYPLFIVLATLLILTQASVISSNQPSQHTCPIHWLVNNGTCYLIEKETRRTFDRAKAWCHIEDGTLFVPLSMEENNFVMSNMAEMAFTWSGLMQTKEAPKWDHNSTVDMEELNWDEPYDVRTNWSSTPDRCAVVENVHGKRKLYWTSCEEEHFYVCEENNKAELFNLIQHDVPIMVNKIVKCENGWIRFENSCYFLERKEKETFNDAEYECGRKNATLFKPNTREEYKTLLANTEKFAHTWTGLPEYNDDLHQTEMDWLVKTPYYHSAANGHSYFTYNCAAYYNGNVAGGKYNYFYHCSYKFLYICEKKAMFEVQQSTSVN